MSGKINSMKKNAVVGKSTGMNDYGRLAWGWGWDGRDLYPRIPGGENLESFYICSERERERRREKTRWCYQDKKTARDRRYTHLAHVY